MEYLKLLNNPEIKSEILDEQGRFIIVSYYWGKDNQNKNSIKKLTYGQQVERLIDQCRKLNINYAFARYSVFAKKGMYQIALGLKGHFIMKMIEMFPQYNVIFIDSDLQILKYPSLFELEADCFFLNWNMFDSDCFNPYQILLPGAVLGFGNTFAAKKLLTILNSFMIHHLTLAEDKSYSGIITRHFMNSYLRCVWLPETYMYMFTEHVYNPDIGKYTKIVSLNKELKKHYYNPKDLVMIHEDFETGALEDVYNQRVGGKSRYPPRLDDQLGEKLRCIQVKFVNYTNFGLNKKQMKQYEPDMKEAQKEGLIQNKQIVPIKKDKSIDDQIKNKLQQFNSVPFIVVTCINKNIHTDKTISTFQKSCKKFKLPLVLFDETDKTPLNKPHLFNTILRNTKKALVYLDVRCNIKQFPKLFTVKNMDFMTINLNNTTTHLNEKLCSDIRVLKTNDDTLYYFSNNDIVLDFLQIWNEYNHKSDIVSHFQHKTLEYAFNISLAINKMRCYWLPKQYILGPIISFPKKELPKKNVYPNEKMRTFTRSLQQCGLKPRLEGLEPVQAHYYGSPNGAVYHNKYGHMFLEF